MQTIADPACGTGGFLDNLPDPEDLAEEIIENIEAGLNSFREIAAALDQGG